MTQVQSNFQPDRVLTVTRVLAMIIVPVLVAAFIMLYLFPNNSDLLFAWPIKPTMSAMMLGGTYLGGAYFFTQVARVRHWHTVKLGLLPVSTFAGVLGISTALHWDKFTPGHISFILWAFLYFTLPFIIPLVWYINRQANQDTQAQAGVKFSRPFTLTIGSIGIILSVASLLLLLFPNIMIPTWPWTLTPLTARVISAMFALSGFVALGVAVDGHWDSARIPLQAQGISVILILLAMVRAAAEISWNSWGSWLFLSGLLLVLILIGWAIIESRRMA